MPNSKDYRDLEIVDEAMGLDEFNKSLDTFRDDLALFRSDLKRHFESTEVFSWGDVRKALEAKLSTQLVNDVLSAFREIQAEKDKT
jgi:hypothetical protein